MKAKTNVADQTEWQNNAYVQRKGGLLIVAYMAD